MKLTVKREPPPPPPETFVIEMTREEAGKLKALLGGVESLGPFNSLWNQLFDHFHNTFLFGEHFKIAGSYIEVKS